MSCEDQVRLGSARSEPPRPSTDAIMEAGTRHFNHAAELMLLERDGLKLYGIITMVLIWFGLLFSVTIGGLTTKKLLTA